MQKDKEAKDDMKAATAAGHEVADTAPNRLSGHRRSPIQPKQLHRAMHRTLLGSINHINIPGPCERLRVASEMRPALIPLLTPRLGRLWLRVPDEWQS